MPHRNSKKSEDIMKLVNFKLPFGQSVSKNFVAPMQYFMSQGNQAHVVVKACLIITLSQLFLSSDFINMQLIPLLFSMRYNGSIGLVVNQN